MRTLHTFQFGRPKIVWFVPLKRLPHSMGVEAATSGIGERECGRSAFAFGEHVIGSVPLNSREENSNAYDMQCHSYFWVRFCLADSMQDFTHQSPTRSVLFCAYTLHCGSFSMTIRMHIFLSFRPSPSTLLAISRRLPHFGRIFTVPTGCRFQTALFNYCIIIWMHRSEMAQEIIMRHPHGCEHEKNKTFFALSLGGVRADIGNSAPKSKRK